MALTNSLAGLLAFEGNTHRGSDGRGEHGWNGIPYLLVPSGRMTGEPESVRKGLNSGGLPNGEGAVLSWVDVAVAVLGNVGGNGSGEILWGVLFKNHLSWDIATTALHGAICHLPSHTIGLICNQTATALLRCPRTGKEAGSCLIHSEPARRQSPGEPERPTPCSTQP